MDVFCFIWLFSYIFWALCCELIEVASFKYHKTHLSAHTWGDALRIVINSMLRIGRNARPPPRSRKDVLSAESFYAIDSDMFEK